MVALHPRWLLSLIFLAASPTLHSQQDGYGFENAQTFLKQYCQACHQGKSPAGGFHLQRVAVKESLQADAEKWSKLNARIKNGDMPPKGAPGPALDEREQFISWVDSALRSAACAGGIVPGPAPIRRLNRNESTSTIRDLFDIHLDVGHALPADGAGGEGFDNAAETLFLSPLHSEKYMEVAKFAMDFAAKEFKSREKILIAKPGSGVSPDQAAREILKAFLPRAFRRPVNESDIGPYIDLFHAARKQGQSFEPAILFSLRAALVSPMFLYRVEPPNNSPEPRPLDQFALASRLSYFLCGSIPDDLLFDSAAQGKLHKPAGLRAPGHRILPKYT